MPDPEAEDGALIGRLRRALTDCALAGETVTYNDLAGRIDFPAPHRIHRLTELLEVTIREDHAAGLPLLAAMAVSRSQNGIPGRGFFQLLAQLGRYNGPDQGPVAAKAHAAEMKAAIAFWGAAPLD